MTQSQKPEWGQREVRAGSWEQKRVRSSSKPARNGTGQRVITGLVLVGIQTGEGMTFTESGLIKEVN